ncbi:MAG: hypothetical protein ABFS32_20885, partial [Bacteroidota bacterium]
CLKLIPIKTLAVKDGRLLYLEALPKSGSAQLIQINQACLKLIPIKTLAVKDGRLLYLEALPISGSAQLILAFLKRSQ